MRESELRCFDHVHKWVAYALVKKSELIQVKQSKKVWGRPKITLEEIAKHDMSIKVLFFNNFLKKNKQTKVNFTNHDMPYIWFFFLIKNFSYFIKKVK